MSDELFPGPDAWKARTFVNRAQYDDLYAKSVAAPEDFWRGQAETMQWIKPFTKVKDVSYDAADLHIKWFYDGTLNVCANCIDRHLPQRANQTAILWEGDDPKDSKAITYAELLKEVSRFANVLKAKGEIGRAHV